MAKLKKVVVFGGSGFVGRILAQELSKDRCKIVVVSRRPQRCRELGVFPTLQLLQGDINDCDLLPKLIEGADAVINLVGILHESGKNVTFDKIHARFPHNLAAACLDQQVQRLIHVSAIGASVNAPSLYLQSKGRGEAAIIAAMDRGLDATVFRPSVIIGADDSFTRAFAKFLRMAWGFFVVVSPNSVMQPVYVRDVAHCIARSLNLSETIGNCYTLAGPDRYELHEIFSMIDKCIGRKHKFIHLSDAQSKLLASFLQFMPDKPITPDNLLSLSVPSVSEDPFPEVFGVQPQRIEHLIGDWLCPTSDRMDSYRGKRVSS